MSYSFAPTRTRKAARLLLASYVLCVLSPFVLAETILGLDQANLNSLEEFDSPKPNWVIGGAIGGDGRHDKNLIALPGAGILINTIPQAHSDLRTKWTHGDIELDVDFLVTTGSNSGIYFQGRYELQILDSWGVSHPQFSDCGGIYERWDETRSPDQRGFDGHAPSSNASRAPGLWQHFHVIFQAPRFDTANKKIANARFVLVQQNGVTIQQEVSLSGPTRGAIGEEAPLGPLILQGDHGAVAFRNLRYKKTNDRALAVTDVKFRFHKEDFRHISNWESAESSLDHSAVQMAAGISGRLHEYDTPPADQEGGTDRIDQTIAKTHDAFEISFEGKLPVTVAGEYALRLGVQGDGEVDLDGQEIAVARDGAKVGKRSLPVGVHSLRVFYLYKGGDFQRKPPSLEVAIEGPGMKLCPLTAKESAGSRQVLEPLVVEVHDRVLLQRGFVPFEPRKRLYAVSIGSPAGVHYAYDFEWASLLRIWKGPFIDTAEMWRDRGNFQTAKALGQATTFPGEPSLAVLRSTEESWPRDPDPLLRSRGYRLEKNGQPVFLYSYRGTDVSDRIAADDGGYGLVRRFEIGKGADEPRYFLLAESSTISEQSAGHYIIGDREYYLDLTNADSLHPLIRNSGKQVQLIAPLSSSGVKLEYSILW